MLIVQKIVIVHVQCLQALASQRANGIGRIITHKRTVANVKTGNKMLVVQRIKIADEFACLRAGGIDDNTLAFLIPLPHIFKRDLYAVFLGIGQKRAIKFHIDLKQLFLVPSVGHRPVQGVNDHRVAAKDACDLQRAHLLGIKLLGECRYIGKIKAKAGVRLIERDAQRIGVGTQLFGIPAIIGRVENIIVLRPVS